MFSSACNNAYTLLISVNMWCETNKLKIHTEGMAANKKEGWWEGESRDSTCTVYYNQSKSNS